ncbi:flagellar biosynthesis protein FlhB [Atopococcus tabaci]|uniref:flagellar biosynthesis protein FlhB n=1 Tax=Atopococcus tabaci TaxID=269774 RepID=UPI0003FA2982|nr:flagellar biosynthesis protein FlhB [Atopococcus tabaci]
MSDKDGKTEKPSPKRLRDARKKGEVPKSQDLSSAISFSVFTLGLVALMSYVFQHGFVLFKTFLSSGLSVTNLEADMAAVGMKALVFFFVLAGPALALAFFTGIIGNMVQVGFLFTAKSLKPSFGKMNPVSNAKNMFGKKAFFGLLKNLLKLGIVFGLTYSVLKESMTPILNLSSLGTERIFFVLAGLAQEIGKRIALFLLVVGVADYAYQRYEHRKNLSMTKQEVKEEFKESEGDPQMKSQRKQRHKEMISGNMKDVESAAVVITNPTHFAVAIRYERGKDDVPTVVVKGADHMAQLIKERAREHDVPIIENKPVARSLYKSVEPGQPVPAAMYQAIAEILALIYRLEESKKHKI